MSSAFLLPFVYLAAVLETWLAPRWEVSGAGPDLMVLVAFTWLACSTSRGAIFVVAMVGLASDLGSSAPLGIGLAAFALAGYCVVWLRRRLVLDHFPARLGMIWFAATATTLLQGFVLRLIGQSPLPMRTLFERGALVGPRRQLAVCVADRLHVPGADPLGVSLRDVGLAVGFRANVWNIGAEGQFIMGAVAAGGVALQFFGQESPLLLPAMVVAGAIGGALWAAIPALLRTRFNANEILVSLMLVYVAVLLLGSLVHGALRDPDGLNFPESRLFQTALPILIDGTRAHVGFLVALVAVGLSWLLLERHFLGFKIKVLGQAPRAARFGGFSDRQLIWFCFLVSGGCAGLAGLFEAAGPVGQLVPALPAGYGFTAIIVAFLGRLHPVGILFAGLLLALTYIGGETAQISMSLPSATTAVFQGMFLFFLLATDVLEGYRPRWISRRAPASTAPRPAPAQPMPRPAAAQPGA
jgi:simple sugar transport system permease protein